MTQQEIIAKCWREFGETMGDPTTFSPRFNFHKGATAAFQYAHQAFKELLEEHFGDEEEWRDEKEDMLHRFEERIGLED